MMQLTTNVGVFGPYVHIDVGTDRYLCDGAELPFSVVGNGNIEECDPANFVLIEDSVLIADLKQRNIDALWAAATQYQERYISGLAGSLLTIGVLRGLPKALAIRQWVSDLWNVNYYPRRAQVTHSYDPSLYDFSNIGPMPYSVPELNSEVEAAIAGSN